MGGRTQRARAGPGSGSPEVRGGAGELRGRVTGEQQNKVKGVESDAD